MAMAVEDWFVKYGENLLKLRDRRTPEWVNDILSAASNSDDSEGKFANSCCRVEVKIA